MSVSRTWPGVPLALLIASLLALSVLAEAPPASIASSHTTVTYWLDYTYSDTDWGLKFVPRHPDDTQLRSYLWNFGDGSTSTRSSPTHWYEKPGTYSVELTGTFTNNLTLTVNRTVVVDDHSQLARVLHSIERDNGRISLHIGNQDVVFTELSLLVTGGFGLAAGWYSTTEQKRFRRKGIRETTGSKFFRYGALAWGLFSVLMLLWLKSGGY